MKNKILKAKPKYSIICLIYKSNEWLDFVYNQVIKYTDFDDTEFFFIANNATDEVKQYLKENYIPHYIYDSTEEQKEEWYINNVYRWYNYWAQMAKWEHLVFINSDMTFSKDWLENLASKYNWKNCVASRLIESWRFFTWKYWLEKDFWTEFFNYKEEEFISFSEEYKEKWVVKDGWLYMPLLINKEQFIDVWMYPEWNIKQWSDLYNPVIAKQDEKRSFTWDEALMEKLKHKWIKHVTSFDSIVYHFQAWELSYDQLNSVNNKINICIYNDIIGWIMWEKVLWNYLIDKLPWNVYWIDKDIIQSNWDFEKDANKYLLENYPNTDLIIQNATFINAMDNSIPKISYLQDDIRKMWQSTTLQEENLRNSNLIVTNSVYTQESYKEYDSEIIPIWLNNELFTIKDKNKLKQKYNIPNWFVWIFVWSLLEAKWWWEIKDIIINNKNVDHWIVVSKYEENLDLKNVSFYTQLKQENLSELINCADFFILWSKVETQCLAALEAALCNVPLVMRNIWIFKEFSEKDKKLIWEFSENFNNSIEILKANQWNYSPRKLIMEKWLDIDSMITKWIELISYFIMYSKRADYLWNKNNINNRSLLIKIEVFVRKKILSKFWLWNLNFNNLKKLSFYKQVLYSLYKKILWK